MFELADPWWLLALPLAALPIFAWFRPHVLRFPGAAAGRSAFPGVITVLPALAEALAIGFTVVALARPQHVETETVRDSDGLDILLAIDTSGSMRSPDMGRGLQPLSRLDASKAVMQRFVEARQDDRLGLLVFGEEAFVQVPPTLDSGALVDFIGSLELGMAGGNATAVGDAIAVGVKRLKDLKAPSKLIILVTDGKSNSGMVQPMDAAAAAKALGVKVYTIGVGTSQIDEATLSAVARTTGGAYYAAANLTQLADVYKEIDSNEKTTAQVREYVHRDELYLDWAFPALLFYVAAFALSRTALRRLP
jgi:Ca-activated chloride channel family protein